MAATRWLSCGALILAGAGWLGTPAYASTTVPHRLAAELTFAPGPAPSGQQHVEAAGLRRSEAPGWLEAARAVQGKTDLEKETGLSVTIDDIHPAALEPGESLTLSGSVSNDGATHWRDAQVYLDIEADPATSRTALTGFAETDTSFGTRIVEIGLFDQIGPIPPGASVPYALTLPFNKLPISRAPGVYHVGVSVLAQNENGRDVNADARTATVMPLLPRHPSGLAPTRVVTLIPLTAPVLRQSNGNFLDDSLVEDLSIGGRLRNVLDFAAEAPPRAVQIVIDPALRAAARDMAAGYIVQTLGEAARGERGRPGGGQREAADWLAELDEVTRHQQMSLMAWGSPDASYLAVHRLPGVVEAAVMASQNYASHHKLNDALVGWQTNGASTRRGLSVTRQSGTSVQVVAENSLTGLRSDDSYPPALVALPTELGPLTALVVRGDVAGEPLTANTSAISFRQDMLAEATVRSLSDDQQAHFAVFAVPFRWDPGLAAGNVNLKQAYSYPAVEPRTGDFVSRQEPTPYAGAVQVIGQTPQLSTGILSAIASLRDNGRILTGMLSDREQATIDLNEQLGLAGSSAWKWKPRAGEAMIREHASALAAEIAKVTVTGPTFVALSSQSGRFPLTVTNGLDEPIMVRLNVKPQNPALKIEPIDVLELAAGQRRDVQVISRTDGSGVTQVRVRLSTLDDRPFGAPWNFNVRATQFGLVIWIAMGAGAAVLFGAAALRIYARIRESRASARDKAAAS